MLAWKRRNEDSVFKMSNLYNSFRSKQKLQIDYRKKFKRLKTFIRDLVIENAAICDQVAQVQENILIRTEERRYLLRKVYQYEPHSDLETQINKNAVQSSSSNEQKKNKKRSHADNSDNKPKPRKSNSRVRKKMVQQIPLDSTGRPVFPIELGSLTIHSLGEVISDRAEFHSEEVIFPVGYVSTRVYGSVKDPRVKCVYTCKISDNNGIPRFDITADNDIEDPIVGSSPDVCHTRLLRYINEAFNTEVVSTKPRGNEFFGLSHPTILNLIQSSPGTRKCVNYKWNKFEVNRNLCLIGECDSSLNYESLQRSINYSNYKTVPEIKEEPPDDIMDDSTGTLRDLLMS